MAEAANPQIDLAQPVKEQQPCPHCWVLELLLHEFERREHAHFEQASPRGAAFKQAPPLVGRQWRRFGFGREDIPDNGDELVMPAA